MKIVFFLESLSQPRCIKRIVSLWNKGFEVEVYGYHRGVHDCNKYPEGINVVDWGYVVSGSGYYKRLCRIYKDIKNVIRQYNKTEVLYYAFGLDMSSIVFLLKKHNYIYESSDLIYTYFHNSLIVNIFKNIDRLVIKNSYKTIFTSEGFCNYLYPNKNISNKIIVQPNKVSPSFKDVKRNIFAKSNGEGLVFAYIGAFRYPDTVFRFAKIIGEKFPKHKFYFYGDSNLTPLAKELSSKYSNIKYFGKYKNPDDLQDIYNSVYIAVACYHTDNLNDSAFADPNKFYESICFCKPIVVSKGTLLSKKVKRLGIGFSIDAYNDDNIISFINTLDYQVLKRMSTNEFMLDQKEYIDSIEDIASTVKTYFLHS